MGGPGEPLCVLSCSVMSDSFATSRTVARQAPLSMGFSRQEYWSGLPCPPPGDLPDPGDKTCVSCIAGSFFITPSMTWFFRSLWIGIHGFPGGSNGKDLPAVQETWVLSLGWEDPLEKGMAIHSSILAWRIPWTV